MSAKRIIKNNKIQRLSESQWRWVWSAYWRLWPVLLRIKFKQLFGSMSWLAKKITLSDKPVNRGESTSIVGLEMHESVRLAARLHFHSVECLPKSIVLADMLTARGLGAFVVIGVNKTDGALKSHAWVELNGLRVAEAESIPLDFTVLKH